MLIDAAVAHFTGGAARYDNFGEMAAAGTVSDVVLRELLTHPFLARPPPKSSGREEFGVEFLHATMLRHADRGLPAADWAATLAQLTIRSIADCVQAHGQGATEMYVSGGGQRNNVLMAGLAAALPGVAVRPIMDLGVTSEAKEALAFAALAYCTRRGIAGNVPSATGARYPAILGKLAYAPRPKLEQGRQRLDAGP